MLLMPFVFRFLTVRGILLLGLCAWAAALRAAGVSEIPGRHVDVLPGDLCSTASATTSSSWPGSSIPIRSRPPHLRSTAQGFITFVTYGVGMLIGSLLSGGVLDYFSTTTPAASIRNWRAFWLSSAIMSFAITLLVLFFFRSSVMIRPAERTAELVDVTA